MKKNYVVTVKNASDWKTIHGLLTQDGTLEDNIPTRVCECTDIQDDNETRSTYLLDNEEVELLSSNPLIKSVNIDINFHRDFKPTPAEIIHAADRFPVNSRIYRQAQDDGIVSPPDSFLHGNAPAEYPTLNQSEQYRTGYQYSRVKQYSDPYLYDNPAEIEPRQKSSSYSQTVLYPELTASWWQEVQIKKPSNVLNERVTYENDGTGIDCVIVDDGVWLGHPEFVATDGTRLVRDIIVDGPYAIDPDWFDADPINRLRQYMGVTTPTDAEAKAWWTNSSNRSPQFASIGVLTGLGDYSLLEVNGSNNSYATFDDGSATHGTAAAGLVYGKSFGHAFNSNKWTILFDFGNESYPYPVSSINVWKALKIWHLNKQQRNPLVINASIQSIYAINSTDLWYWKYRDETGSFQTTSLSGVTTQTEVENILQDFPNFLRTSPYQVRGLPNALRGTVNSPTNAGGYTVEYDTIAELCGISDVFIFVAGGNQRQKVVKPSHPDYNNYVSVAQSPTEEQKVYTHRGGYIYDVIPPGFTERPVFHVGALDDNKINDNNIFKERITSYSTRGNGVDIYSPADDVLTASGDPSIYAASGPYFFPRYQGDAEYPGQTVQAFDTRFNGTSAASPVTAGFFAAFLQNRRDWTPIKVKNYIQNSIVNQPDTTFYYGQESLTAFDNNHFDLFTLEGGEAKVLYSAAVPSINITTQPQEQTITAGNIVTFSVIATEDSTTGVLSYQWEKAQSTNTSAFTTIFGANSNTYQFTSTINDNGDVYRCVINGTGGVDETISNEVVLSVLEAPPQPLPVKTYLNAIDYTVLMGIKPKQYLYNRFGSEIYNKKEIFPKSFSIFSQEDCEIKIIRQKACPEFAYTHQEGYRWGLLPESRRIKAKFSVNNFSINESALGITLANAASHTATLAYAGASEGSWRSPNDPVNYTVAGSEVLRVVGDDLFQLAITGKNLSGVDGVFKLQRIENGGYLSSRNPTADVENVYLPFTYAPVGEYSSGYEVELDYYRRDQTLLSSVNIISDEFFIFWTGGDRGGIDSTHRSTVRIGFAWPDVSSPSSLIHVSRNGDKWGIETPEDVGGDFVSYDGQKFYEGIPVDFIKNYQNNILYVETNTELNINTYNLEVNEYDIFDDFWDLGDISVPGAEGGECHGLGCKAGRELREAEIVVYEEDQGNGVFVDTYYLQDLSPWPSLGEPYSITITQGTTKTTLQVNNPITKVAGDAIVYLLPLGTSLPTGLEKGDVEVTYNIIYIATIDKQSRVQSILTSKIAPGDLPYVRVFMQGRQGASMGGMWIGQKTPNGIVLDPFTPHRSTVNIKDSGSESHGESFPAPDTKTDGAIKVINTYTQVDSFGKSTAPTNNIGTDTLDTYKSIHSNPRKCGSFLSAGGTNAAGILTPTDYPIRWLTSQSSGLPLATFYVSKNESVEISLEEIFNVDAESVVNSDDANLATIFIARSLNNHSPTGSEKEIYMTLNYDEQ